MAKIVLNPITGSYASVVAINSRMQLIEDAFNLQVLYRDNPPGEINSMQNDLDMNGYTFLNFDVTSIPGGEGLSLDDAIGYAQEWAQNPIDVAVSVEAGGDGSTTFSSLHWATNAAQLSQVFDDRYLGAHASAPTTLNDGITVLDSSHEGIEYWNSTTNDRWTWTGTVWQLTSSSVATSANLVSIVDVGGHYTGTEVETALQEVGKIFTTNVSEGATLIGINDFNQHFILDNVEAALAEAVIAAHGSIVGLESEYASGTTFSVKEGRCLDELGTQWIKLSPALSKNPSIAWVAGNANGSWDGQGADPTTISGIEDIWAILNRTTGVVDILTSHTGNTPTFPTGYDRKRYIGSLYQSLGAVSRFIQEEDKIFYEDSIQSVAPSGATLGVKNSVSLITPSSAEVWGDITVTWTGSSSSITAAQSWNNNTAITGWQKLFQDDSAAATKAVILRSKTTSASQMYVAFSGTGSVSPVLINITGHTCPKRNNP